MTDEKDDLQIGTLMKIKFPEKSIKLLIYDHFMNEYRRMKMEVIINVKFLNTIWRFYYDFFTVHFFESDLMKRNIEEYLINDQKFWRERVIE